MNLVVVNALDAQSKFARMKKVADLLTSGGTNPAGLEGSAEFNVAAGQGGAFYNNLVSLKVAFDGMASLPDFDPGQ